MIWRMAWRNLWRHRRRTLLTAGALAVSTAFVLGLMAYVDGMYLAMTRVMVEQSTGHVQVNHPSWAESRGTQYTVKGAGRLLEGAIGLPGVRASSGRLYGYALLGGAEQTAGAQLTGIVPARERGISPIDERLVEGRFLGDVAAHEIVLGAGLAKLLDVEVGGEVVAVTQSADGSLGNELYRVVGIATAGSVAADRSGAWLHLNDLQELLVLPDQLHQVVLIAAGAESRVDDPTVAGLVAPLQALSPGAAVRTWWEAAPQTAQMLAMSDVSAWITMGIVFGVAGLGVLNTMLMSVFERTRELGVMKALGTRPGRVVRLVLAESLWLSGLSLGGGLVLGGACVAYLMHYGIDLTVNGERLSSAGVLFDPVLYGELRPDRFGFTVAFLLVVTVLAALWPAVRAARLRPVDAMRDR